MTDHLLVAGLASELLGAAVLAKSLATGRVEDYVIGSEGEYGRSLAVADLARASDMTDAGVGLALIGCGIAAQLWSALGAPELGR